MTTLSELGTDVQGEGRTLYNCYNHPAVSATTRATFYCGSLEVNKYLCDVCVAEDRVSTLRKGVSCQHTWHDRARCPYCGDVPQEKFATTYTRLGLHPEQKEPRTRNVRTEGVI